MRNSFLIPALTILFCLTSVAQSSHQVNTPKLEFFGGYSFLHQYDNGEFQGWEASLSGNINRWFALKGDFSGHYAEEDFTAVTLPPPSTFTFPAETFHQSIHYFLGGPEFSYRRTKWRLYAHALVGAAHGHQSLIVHNPPPGFMVGSNGVEDTGFAFGVGAGGDWMFSKRIGWRVAQADYLEHRFDGEYQNNVRISSGLIFQF
jgi:hypothetical protein